VISVRSRILELALVAIVIAAGVTIRVRQLDVTPFWVDEAESSINALTILDHGYPTDHYLGIPIFENTLVQPWPGNPEYEFKDLSYSDRGIAIYHGWVPLYSMAASFALNGIQPDQITDRPPARDLNEMKRRTRAARMPAVVFGALFLAVCYIAGTLIYGRDAGFAALLMASVAAFHINASIQARYFSALIMVSACTVLALWLILKKGTFRYYAAGALTFLLLFMTHMVTFAAGVLVLVLVTPVLVLRHTRVLPKLVLFGAILLTGVAGWVTATGFFSRFGVIPAARTYLSFPRDFFTYPIARGTHVALVIGFLLMVAAAFSPRLRMPLRLRQPLRDSASGVFIIALWIVAAYASFFLLMPAVSFDTSRLKFPFWGPALLLASIVCAVIARIIAPRHSIWVAPAAAAVMAGITGVHFFAPRKPVELWNGIDRLAAHLQEAGLTAKTKLYAVPNSHLILSFYTGLPFQNIYAVRKTFLDTYDGDILYVDFDEFALDGRDGPLDPARLGEAAAMAGEVMDEPKAHLLSTRLRTMPYRQWISGTIGGIPVPSAEPVPAYAGPLIASQAQIDAQQFAETLEIMPILRGFPIDNRREWVGVFEYRFADPASRTGTKLNFAERLRGSRAHILNGAGWVVYHSPGERDRSAPVEFQWINEIGCFEPVRYHRTITYDSRRTHRGPHFRRCAA
jgi:hypothetical protein